MKKKPKKKTTEQKRQYGKYCYKNLSEKQKEIKRGYGRDLYRNLSNDKKEKLKEYGRNYCESLKEKANNNWYKIPKMLPK